jgi:4-carboxymuconolactone decarboxylase
VPRIPLITQKAELPEDRHAEFDAIVAVLHQVGGPFGILMRSPGLAQKVMEAGAHVRLKSTLTMPQRELLILAVSREKDAGFEWASHVTTGRKEGLSEAAIEAARYRDSDLGALTDDERDLILFVRQLLRTNRVQQDLFDRLLARHDERWLVEVTATVGQYQYISAINNTFDLQPRQDAPDKLPI